MYDFDVMRNAAKRNFTLFDKKFVLTVFESDDIYDIKRYIQAVINDFEEDALSDTVLLSKEDGLIESEELIEWVMSK